MSNTVARRVGIILVVGPVGIWVLSALGVGVDVPSEHFATLIWAGVSLILGFDIRSALVASGSGLPTDSPANDGQEDTTDES